MDTRTISEPNRSLHSMTGLLGQQLNTKSVNGTKLEKSNRSRTGGVAAHTASAAWLHANRVGGDHLFSSGLTFTQTTCGPEKGSRIVASKTSLRKPMHEEKLLMTLILIKAITCEDSHTFPLLTNDPTIRSHPQTHTH